VGDAVVFEVLPNRRKVVINKVDPEVKNPPTKQALQMHIHRARDVDSIRPYSEVGRFMLTPG
jgi:hypothetical protein